MNRRALDQQMAVRWQAQPDRYVVNMDKVLYFDMKDVELRVAAWSNEMRKRGMFIDHA